VTCKFCGTSLAESAKFCGHCGKHQASGLLKQDYAVRAGVFAVFIAIIALAIVFAVHAVNAPDEMGPPSARADNLSPPSRRSPGNAKPGRSSTEHSGKSAEGGLAAGDRAVIYSSWLMPTEEQANHELQNAHGNAEFLEAYEKLAVQGKLLNCFPSNRLRPSIGRTSVEILDVASFVGGKAYRRVRITGVLRGEEGEQLRSAGFAEEDRVGTPEDCFFLEWRGNRLTSATNGSML